MGSVGSSKKTTNDFNNYDVSNLSDNDITQIAEYLQKNILDDYEFVGIRAVEPEYATELRNSYRWEDGEMTDEELSGVSSLDTKISYWDDTNTIADKLKQAIKDIKLYSFGNRKPFIVYSDNSEGGEDINELVIIDPKILNIRKILKK